MADDTQQPAFDSKIQQGENQDDYLNRLLTSGQYGNAQDAINTFNTNVFGSDSGGKSRLDPGDAGYGKSPALYGSGNGQQIGLPGYYLTQQADGSWQKTQRTASKPNLPPAQSPLAQAGQAIQGGINDASGTNVGNAGPKVTDLNIPGLALPSLNVASPQTSQNPQQAAINQQLQGMQKAI